MFLFGSRSRGDAREDSDYDIVVVSDAFAGQEAYRRALDRRRYWRQAGGWGIGLDLHCYTREEFRKAVRGLGFIGQAKRRGELKEIRVSRRRAPRPAEQVGGSSRIKSGPVNESAAPGAKRD